MRIYGIKACDTCRKARKEAEAAGLAPTFVDVRETPLAAADVARFLDAFGEGLVNRRSTTWRALDAEARALAPQALLAAYPTVMKRPVIETDAGLFLGWRKDVQKAVLPAG